MFAVVPAVGQAAKREDRCKAQNAPITNAASVRKGERSLLCLVNVHRAANGLPALALEPALRRSARAHSRDMVARNYFDHTTPERLGPEDRAGLQGYEGGVGENIAYTQGSGTPLAFFLLWRDSDGHNRNMLRKDYTVAGMGFAVGTPERGIAGVTGTQVFGTQSTGARDIALDMLVPGKCPPARAALRRAKKKLKVAKKRGRRVAKAKRKVKRKKRAVRRACKADGF